MKPIYANIQDLPSGKSLAAVRAQSQGVRNVLKTAIETDQAVMLQSCAVRLTADDFTPCLTFEDGGKTYFFPVNNKWFKRAKSELAAGEALVRSLRNRDKA